MAIAVCDLGPWPANCQCAGSNANIQTHDAPLPENCALSLTASCLRLARVQLH